MVLFHAGVEPLSQGSVGFAVAFVVSGYLLTGTLLGRFETDRPPRWRSYPLRRGERLLPALLASTLLSVPVLRWVLSVDVQDRAADTFRAGVLLVGNWQIIGDASGPVAPAIIEGAGQHLWAVGVLAQLSLIWPVVLIVLHRLGRIMPGAPVLTVRVGTLVLTVASVAGAWILSGESEARALYGTDTLAHQFLLGALLALAPLTIQRSLRRRKVLAAALGLVASLVTVVLATDLVPLDPVPRGTVVALAAALLLAAIERSPGVLRRAFATDPLPYLGRIAHGTYLWHWPVIVATLELAPAAQPYQVGVVAVVVGAGLAALTHELIERPVQSQEAVGLGRSAFTGAMALAVVFLGLVVVHPALQPEPGVDTTTEGPGTPLFTSVPRDLALDSRALSRQAVAAEVDCRERSPDACTVVEGNGSHVVLLGDSLVVPLIPAFEAIARSRDLSLSVVLTHGCPWQGELGTPVDGVAQPCDEITADIYDRILPALEPSVVVVGPGAVATTLGLTPFDRVDPVAAALELQTPPAVDRLDRLADRVVLIEPMPVVPADPLACLERAEWLEDCRFVTPEERPWIELTYLRLTEPRRRLVVLDLDPLVCPYLPICDPVISRQVVRRDPLHLTQGFGATLDAPLEELLDLHGLLADP